VTVLLDGNVLVGLVVTNHVFHDAAEVWIQSYRGTVASCPITQGTLVRLLIRDGYTGAQAQDALRALLAELPHEFWPDDLGYRDVPLNGVVGHRQVTDAYLAALTRHHAGRLATFDHALAELHSDIAELVPVS